MFGWKRKYLALVDEITIPPIAMEALTDVYYLGEVIRMGSLIMSDELVVKNAGYAFKVYVDPTEPTVEVVVD